MPFETTLPPTMNGDQDNIPDPSGLDETDMPAQLVPAAEALGNYVEYSNDDIPPSPYNIVAGVIEDGPQQSSVSLSRTLFAGDASREVQQLPDGTYIKFRSWDDWKSRVRTEDDLAPQECLDLGRQLHAELVSYGVNMTPTTDTVGESPTGDLGYFMRSVPVQGTEIMDVPKDVPVELLEGLYSSLARYYLDKLHSGGKYLNDLNNSQFVYGCTPEDPDYKIYLIDQEPTFIDVEDYPPLSATIRNLQNMIALAESRTGVPLPRAQAAIGEALSYAAHQ